MKRFSKPVNKVDLSSPVFFRWYRWFRVLNQTAQTRRHLALFFIIWDPSGLDFEGRVEVKRTQGVLNSDKILTTELRLLTSSVRKMCSLLGDHFKICGQREVWNQDLCLTAPGSSRFPMRRLWGRGWNLSSPRIFRKFWISNHPTTFIISRLLSFHSPQNLKLQNVVRTLRLYLITSFQHFWTTHVNATGSRTFFLSGLK